MILVTKNSDQARQRGSVCVCLCARAVLSSHLFILDVRVVDVPAGIAEEEGHTGFLHLPSAVLASIFLARRVQPFLSLVDSKVKFCVLTNYSFSTCWAFFVFARKNPSSCDCTEIQTHVPTSDGFEVTN